MAMCKFGKAKRRTAYIYKGSSGVGQNPSASISLLGYSSSVLLLVAPRSLGTSCKRGTVCFSFFRGRGRATVMGSSTWALALLTCLVAVAFGSASAKTTPPPPASPVTTQTLQKVASSLQMYVDALPQMPKIYGYRLDKKGSPLPVPLKIGMYATTWKFHRDLPPTPVFVYGRNKTTATFPGPTIYARQGTPLQVTWENHLPKAHILPWDPTVPTAIPKLGGVPTVVHLHGSAHSPLSDGSAFAWFTFNFRETGPLWTQKTYTYPNVQPPGNLWYHDHALGLTRANLLAGLLGAYVIHKPSIDDVMDLPTGPDTDRHLIIADRSFNTDGSIYMNRTGVYPQLHPQWQPEYFGEAMTVNGKAWPFLNVKQKKYRFRVINVCNARYLNLSLSNGQPFYVLGSDGSYLVAPVLTSDVVLAPSEAADILIDFSRTNTSTVELLNSAPYPYAPPPVGAPPGPLMGKVMRFNVSPMASYDAPDHSIVPKEEVKYANVSYGAAPTLTRHIVLYEYAVPTGQTSHFLINGLRLTDPATETPKVGSTELWNVINLTPDNHPLHMHIAMFQAVKVQRLVNLPTFEACMTRLGDAVKCNVSAHATGALLPVPEYEKTWKNTIKIEPGAITSIIVKFKIVDIEQAYPFDATVEPGYVYHCHILDHEDNEMIRPLKLRK